MWLRINRACIVFCFPELSGGGQALHRSELLLGEVNSPKNSHSELSSTVQNHSKRFTQDSEYSEENSKYDLFQDSGGSVVLTQEEYRA